MKDTKQRSPKPKEKWARLYVDQSADSVEAVKLLRNSGYRVITFPVNGKMGPELKLEKHVYKGLEQIKNLIEE